MSEKVNFEVKDAVLAGERWGSGGPVVVALHAGVADRRSWSGVAERLASSASVVAYDRRGFGATAASTAAFSHLEDLLAVLDALGDAQVWLLGSSMGGSLALDAAVVAPDRIAGLVLIGSGVSGAPDIESDPAAIELGEMLDRADAAEDLDECNRLETWLWLDGPAGPEGRVGGLARALMTDMNGAILRTAAVAAAASTAGASSTGASSADASSTGASSADASTADASTAGAPSTTDAVAYGGVDDGVAAWDHLAEIRIPVTVACGDLDVGDLVELDQMLAGRLPFGRHVVLPGTAHLPYLEDPAGIADLVAGAIARS